MYDLTVQHRFHLQAFYTLPNHDSENTEIFCLLVMRLLADGILNFSHLELLADKVQLSSFSPLACSYGARTSCATSGPCIIFGYTVNVEFKKIIKSLTIYRLSKTKQAETREGSQYQSGMGYLPETEAVEIPSPPQTLYMCVQYCAQTRLHRDSV